MHIVNVHVSNSCYPQVYDEIIVTQPSEIVEVEEEASVKLTPNPILQYFIPITYKELDSKIAINEEIAFFHCYFADFLV